MVLVDTDVVVDCLRGTAPSREWLQRTSTEALGLPGVVAMELLIGCRNRAEIQHLQRFLDTFSIVWPDASEFARAYELLAEHRLTSGLGIPDCLVAAMALVRKARLYTFNSKHFRVIPGVDAQEPYSRQ
ncbi:MAG: PIN domain-containing protein [Vicinamibacterales bacterium]|jgi:predicted nucleic acid-binding protein